MLLDLYRAYKDARKHKRGRMYQLKFEYELEMNLTELRDELIEGRYKPLPSTCFIIHEPKMREVFAADFRDRVVHHLFYNYTHRLFERTFIADSYSCIEGRGTHYGIERLKHHIRSVSAGYSKPCYVLKIDIRGYFMSIDRARLLELCRATLRRMENRESDIAGVSWGEKIDYVFVDYLLETIIHTDPVNDCHVLGAESDWDNLPVDKSLFTAASGCGLPIGNLSSQLFSNVYMNVFDQYVKRTLGCQHYGRYVDDAYIVASDRNRLKGLIPKLSEFLQRHLGLDLNRGKTRVYDARHGFEFVGAFVRPFRAYISTMSLRRMRRKVMSLPKDDRRYLRAAVNSFLGVLSHYDSYCLRRLMFGYHSRLSQIGKFDHLWLKWRQF